MTIWNEWPPENMCSVVFPWDKGQKEILLCQKAKGHSGSHWSKGIHSEYAWPEVKDEHREKP